MPRPKQEESNRLMPSMLGFFLFPPGGDMLYSLCVSVPRITHFRGYPNFMERGTVFSEEI